jgi:PHD/YefM family antitoxin component YafN of YafNO toxin-antitoxin module
MLQIIPIRDLKNTAAISELANSTNKPIFVTKNGYGDMVIMSMKAYEESIAKIQTARLINESLEDAANGAKVTGGEEFFSEMRKKYDPKV